MTVLVLGCGYVGLELGRQLTDAGERVVGVRRSHSGIEAIEEAGFRAIQADITDPDALSTLPEADTVVYAASSGGRGADAAREIYVEGQQAAIAEFADRDEPPERYLYTSSTGVYGDHDGEWVDEETPLEPTTEKTEVLVEAERVALEATAEAGIDGTVARLAGIYGPDRYRLQRYIEGPVTEGYLNMVHRDDIAGAISFLLEEDLARDEVVLIVDDEPVQKWEFADWLAEECGVDAPPKRTTEERLDDADLSETARRRIETSKRCSNDKLRDLGYEFTYPTYREGYRDRIEQFRASNA
ncbi:NAD-dependent epimerase/dehydratase family protein [Halovenus sp. WSH3]|uniref:NAD-dependent epimerase/dehydratase family protein n=1 Tax=Halovenus carboxidivorans TaxID=2692199 RepID=A0A6B0T1P3_9EURY|nr:SDR family oxidoreductase [Halovenus carboxidivorans]MXR50146.1 NAD-dependent epimerase/dehydratase family protein [Halovenus carboxidivorans]